MTNTFCLIYVSRATKEFSQAQLKQLAESAQKSNKEHGITGILLNSDGHFFQLLEGEEAAVHQLYANIKQDKRHTQLQLLLAQPIQQRHCPVWDMLLLVNPHSSPEQTEQKIQALMRLATTTKQNTEQLVSDLFCRFMTPAQLGTYATPS